MKTKPTILSFLLVLTSLSAWSQKYDTSSVSPETVIFAEEMPEFPGGQQGLMDYMIENTKYPKKARNEGIQGRVVVAFVVNKEGKVTQVKVLKSAHPLLDQAAVNVIKKMPRWKPGRQKGKPVNVRMVQPVVFKLT